MKSLVLLAIFVCVSLRIDAFPHPEESAQILESSPTTAESNVPKVESAEPVKAVEEKTTAQNVKPVEQASAPVVAAPVPAEPKQTPSIISEPSKQSNGETSNVKTETTATTSDSIPPKADNLPEIKDVADASEKGTETDLPGSTAEKGTQTDNEEEHKDSSFEFDFGFNEAQGDLSEMLGDSVGPDDSDMAGGSAAPESSGPESSEEQEKHSKTPFDNLREFLQRIQERLRTLRQNLGSRLEKISDVSVGDGKSGESDEGGSIDFPGSGEGRNVNFPDFAVADDLE